MAGKQQVRKYEDAIMCLNNLQTNAFVLETLRNSGARKSSQLQSLPEFREHMSRIDADSLNVIHIAGTKGKGSTSAFVESILRRIKISETSNSLGSDRFLKTDEKHLNPEGIPEKPSYFRFLCLIAFHAFVQEKVDVAIVEVGIGGEFDSTNIFEKPVAAGITALGIDHTALLGNTISEIAWHKAGIIKSNRPVFTSKQKEEAIDVIKKRAIEKNASSVYIIDDKDVADIRDITLGLAGDHQYENGALAVALSNSFITSQEALGIKFQSETKNRCFKEGLEKVCWPGRAQVLESTSFSNIRWHLDGAHTPESLLVCSKWFQQCINQSENVPRKVLIFNCTHGRDGKELLLSLFHMNDFDLVIFTTNEIYAAKAKSDVDNRNEDKDSELKLQKSFGEAWRELKGEEKVVIVGSIEQAAEAVTKEFAPKTETKQHDESFVLVTGSLLLVGNTLNFLGVEVQ
ncbi:Folylpolyglutamate synthetase [Nowakowskiella sp. JEL0078]|nr:Folylpolyglutamate synthetase [Nowakowskiella sp. JEL0078]